MLGGERGLPWSDDAEKVFKVVGKVFKDAKRPNLTLELAKALRDRAGEPFVPSTPGGLVTLLTAMRPYVSAKRQKPSHAQFLDKKVKVTELLGHYKAKGQVSARAFINRRVDRNGNLCLLVEERRCGRIGRSLGWLVGVTRVILLLTATDMN